MLLPLSAQTKQTGQQLFDSTCAGCHGLDGKGGEHAPNIVGNANLQQGPDADLQRIIQNGIPASGMPAFGSVFKTDQIKTIVSYVRALQGAQKPTLASGDGKAGQALFFGKGHCAECHMTDGKGGFLAADLSGYGKAHSASELLQQIRDHSKEGRHGWTRVVTRGGREYEGLTRNEDNFSLQLQTRNGDFLFFEKANLATVERQPPWTGAAHYVAELKEKDLDNLISYLSQP